MYNRTYKQETKLCLSMPNAGMEYKFKDERGLKHFLYCNGTKECNYRVDECNVKTGEVLNTYIYRVTKGGPILKTNIYSLWKEQKEKARAMQYSLF